MILHTVKIALSLLMFFYASPQNASLLVLFLLTSKVFSEAICRHGNLLLSDVIDEDAVLNSRDTSVSTLMFGANALFTKPGQALGDDDVVIGVCLLLLLPSFWLHLLVTFLLLLLMTMQQLLWMTTL